MGVLDVPGTSRLALGPALLLPTPWLSVLPSPPPWVDQVRRGVMVVAADAGELPWDRADGSLEVLDVGWLTADSDAGVLEPLATECARVLEPGGRLRVLLDATRVEEGAAEAALAAAGFGAISWPQPSFGGDAGTWCTTTWHPPLAAVDAVRDG